MSVRFGTDGVRGVAGEFPITPDVARAVGAAAARLAFSRGGSSVVVARDTRPSGPELAAAVLAGVASVGATALDAGVLPTGGLGAALGLGVGAVGVMVTASHNSWPDNGFKVLDTGGFKPDDSTSSQLEAWIAEGPGSESGEITACPEATVAYHRAMSRVCPEPAALAGKRIAVDLARGAATTLQDWLTEHYADTEFVFTGVDDGLVNDGVGSENPANLQAHMSGCQMGFAVDGDGDRCVLFDGQGLKVSGDALAVLLARGRKDQRMAVTVMSSAAVPEALPGVHVEITPVGDRHLSMAMRKNDLSLGAEDSGHVLFADALPGGDGAVTGLRAAAIVAAAGSVQAAVGAFEPFPRALTKARIARKPALDSVPKLVDLSAAAEADLGAGRVFLRYSGTEPVLRVLVEGPDADKVSRWSAELTQAAQEALG